MNFTQDSRFNFARKQINAINDENYTSVLDLFERACSQFVDSVAFTCLSPLFEWSDGHWLWPKSDVTR